MSPRPEIVRGTVSRILDEGNGTSWKALVLRATVDPRAQEIYDRLPPERKAEKAPPRKDATEEVLVTLSECPSAREGDDIILMGSVVKQPSGSPPRFVPAAPEADAAVTYYASEGRRGRSDLARIAAMMADHVPALEDALAVTLPREEKHSDSVVDDALRRINDPSVARYRPAATLVVDAAAVYARGDDAHRFLGQSMPRGMGEAYRGTFESYVLHDTAIAMYSGETLDGSVHANFVMPVSALEPSLVSLAMFAGLRPSAMVPRERVDPDVMSRFTALHEGAHCYQEGFGLQFSKNMSDAGMRRLECFADAVAVATMVLDGADREQVEHIVRAREVHALAGVSTHTSGLAARQAFEMACKHVDRHGAPKAGDTAGRVPMNRIMGFARRIADDAALKHDADLLVINQAIGSRGVLDGTASAAETAKRIRDAAAELREAGLFTEQEKALRSMELAAAAVGKGMWTAADLSEPENARKYGETVRKDLFATLSNLNRMGYPRGTIDRVIREAEHRVADLGASSAIELNRQAASRGGLDGFLNRIIRSYIDGKDPISFLFGSNTFDREARYVEGKGFPGILRRMLSAGRNIGLLDRERGRAARGVDAMAEATRAAIGKASQAAGRLPDPPQGEQGQRNAFLAMRSAVGETGRNPWHMPLGKRLDMIGDLSRQAATVAMLARAHPDRAEGLQERFDWLMARRADALRSVCLMDETKVSLLKLLGGRRTPEELAASRRDIEATRNIPGLSMPVEAGRRLEHGENAVRVVDEISSQARWDVPGARTRLPVDGNVLAGLTGIAGAFGHPILVPAGRPRQPEAADVHRDKRGFVIKRNDEGKPHCEDDWAVQAPDGRRFAWVNGRKAFVVRIEMPEGDTVTTRLLPENEARIMADAFGGEVRAPTEEDFAAIRRGMGTNRDFLPLDPDARPLERAISFG